MIFMESHSIFWGAGLVWHVVFVLRLFSFRYDGAKLYREVPPSLL